MVDGPSNLPSGNGAYQHTGVSNRDQAVYTRYADFKKPGQPLQQERFSALGAAQEPGLFSSGKYTKTSSVGSGNPSRIASDAGKGYDMLRVHDQIPSGKGDPFKFDRDGNILFPSNSKEDSKFSNYEAFQYGGVKKDKYGDSSPYQRYFLRDPKDPKKWQEVNEDKFSDTTYDNGNGFHDSNKLFTDSVVHDFDEQQAYQSRPTPRSQ